MIAEESERIRHCPFVMILVAPAGTGIDTNIMTFFFFLAREGRYRAW